MQQCSLSLVLKIDTQQSLRNGGGQKLQAQQRLTLGDWPPIVFEKPFCAMLNGISPKTTLAFLWDRVHVSP